MRNGVNGQFRVIRNEKFRVVYRPFYAVRIITPVELG